MILNIVSIILSSITLILVGLFFFKRPKGTGNGLDEMLDLMKKECEELDKAIKSRFEMQSGLYKSYSESINNTLQLFNKNMLDYLTSTNNMQNEQFKAVETRLNNLVTSLENRQDKMLETLDKNLKEIQQNNEKKLDEMRVTVDEKLSSTLEKRLSDSVKIITDGIDQVSKNVGEMRNIASNMSDFKRMLTNVKTRGSWGEVQLGTLLEQMLSDKQYKAQVSIDGSLDRVDYVIVLPGKDNENLYLPVDAKFPMEDYLRICDASEKNNVADLETASKALEKRIKEEAKKINEKYIKVPATTDFAVMYLPVEGLYAEVVKNANLVDQIQREYKILICGPTTFTAFVNSLQMGFRTLAIEKRSSEIWNMLGVFKQEFNKFVDLLGKTQKKLDEASNTIEFATKKTKTIQRKLKSVTTDEDGVDLLEDTDE